MAYLCPRCHHALEAAEFDLQTVDVKTMAVLKTETVVEISCPNCGWSGREPTTGKRPDRTSS